MTNFLHRMAARALGAADMAQPVVPGLFTPGFGLARSDVPRDVAVERTTTADRVDKSAAPDGAREATLPRAWQESGSRAVLGDASTSAPADSLLAQEREQDQDEAAFLSAHHQALSTVAAQAPAAQPAPLALTPLAQPQRADVRSQLPDAASTWLFEPEQKQLSGSNRLPASEPVIAQEVVPARRPAATTFPLGPTIPANAGTVFPRRDPAGSAQAEAPVIRVTIGRIDVRAQFPSPAPSPAPTRHARPAALSLEEYSKQRSEGKR